MFSLVSSNCSPARLMTLKLLFASATVSFAAHSLLMSEEKLAMCIGEDYES
jgi:hypothetical protein